MMNASWKEAMETTLEQMMWDLELRTLEQQYGTTPPSDANNGIIGS